MNPVSSAHFNFSVLEPTGVVSILAPDDTSLLGLVSNLAPTIAGGNTCIVLASDVPGGVVNILTGLRSELTEHFASHMDVNAIVWCDGNRSTAKTVQDLAAENMKRVIKRTRIDWMKDEVQHPYLIRDTQEVKTTWHPIGA